MAEPCCAHVTAIEKMTESIHRSIFSQIARCLEFEIGILESQVFLLVWNN